MGSLSSSSSDNHATLAASLFSASQLATSVVLPKPAGAATSVSGRLKPLAQPLQQPRARDNCGRGGGALILVLSSRVLAGTVVATG